MILCLFIHNFFKIIEWLFKSIINKKAMNSKCNFIVNLKYMTWMIDKIWRLSNSIKNFDFNNDTNFMCNMSHTNRVIYLLIKTYFVISISIKIFNLCWLLSKNKIQLITKSFLTKESNMLSSRIKKILIESKSLNSMFMFIWIICKSCHWRFLYFCALKQNFHVCFNSSQMKHLLVKINVSITRSRFWFEDSIYRWKWIVNFAKCIDVETTKIILKEIKTESCDCAIFISTFFFDFFYCCTFAWIRFWFRQE